MIPGIAPAISKKKADDPGGGYSFTMTAGDLFGVSWGYAEESFIGMVVGEIDHQPIPGETLLFFLSPEPLQGRAAAIVFDGDISSLVGGMSVWVNGVKYDTNTNGWEVLENTTWMIWDPTGPTFVDQGVYFVEIK